MTPHTFNLLDQIFSLRHDSDSNSICVDMVTRLPSDYLRSNTVSVSQTYSPSPKLSPSELYLTSWALPLISSPDKASRFSLRLCRVPVLIFSSYHRPKALTDWKVLDQQEAVQRCRVARLGPRMRPLRSAARAEATSSSIKWDRIRQRHRFVRISSRVAIVMVDEYKPSRW
jgi:hypothetical protein